MSEALAGGCHCGAVRYEAGSIFDAGWCHCSTCRRLSGAPAVTWAHVPARDFRLTSGEPALYRSSARGERAFCARCGAQLFFRPLDEARYVAIHTGTLDRPERVPPRLHVFWSNRLPWFEPEDGLPRYPAGEVPHPDRR
jgi:hypothetical protein